MPDSPPRRLPRGRNALAPEEVRRIQRSRLCSAMAEAMTENGYAGTSVADVLRRAVVSRQSFYQLFDSKFDCFMAAFDCAGELLLERLAGALGDGGGGVPAGEPFPEARLELFERAITAYLGALAEELPYARLFLVEVYAAGAGAIPRRGRLQEIIGDALADLLGAGDEPGRFACRVIVAATSAMVIVPVADRDPDALRALGPPLIHHVRALWDAGVFEPAKRPSHPTRLRQR